MQLLDALPRGRRHLACALVSLLSFGPADVGATQSSPLDRIVGLGETARPIVITTLSAQAVGRLAAAARVPMGLEGIAGTALQPWKVTASGQPLRAVLDAIVAADPRYEWREDNGVAVIRPVSAWSDAADPLHRAAGAIALHEVDSNDTMRIMVRVFGVTDDSRGGPNDARRFSVDLPPGTIVEALDGIVRAHGGLAWAFEPSAPTPAAPGAATFPFTVSLFSGASGVGIGIRILTDATAPDGLEVDGRRPVGAAGSVLDRIVGPDRRGQPIVLTNVDAARSLAETTGVPMGIELLPRTELRALPIAVRATGMTLRDALFELITGDPRYEWRDMEGVIVIRPVAAWNDPGHVLGRPADRIRIDVTTLDEIVRVAHPLFDPDLGLRVAAGVIVDPRGEFVDLAHGTQLELLNAIARTRGSLYWVLEVNDARATRFFGGRRHRLTFLIPGNGGRGFAVP